MAWVEQTGGHSWRVRSTDADGRVRSLSGFATKAEARSFADGARPGERVPVASVDREMQMEDWVKSWLTTLHVSERTEENHRRDLRRHVLPRWGSEPLTSIRPIDVDIWIGQLHAAGYAPATVTTLRKLLPGC